MEESRKNTFFLHKSKLSFFIEIFIILYKIIWESLDLFKSQNFDVEKLDKVFHSFHSSRIFYIYITQLFILVETGFRNIDSCDILHSVSGLPEVS